jgi:hypothetical protein
MGVNASKVKYLLDVDAAVTLRNVADGAETTTQTEAAVSLKELDTAYWHSNEIPHGLFAVQVVVTALDRVDGNETYTLSLLVDDTSDMSDAPSTIASYTITAAGSYTFYLDSKAIEALNPESSGLDKWLAIRATLGGTTPSITYGAWIAKNLAP